MNDLSPTSATGVQLTSNAFNSLITADEMRAMPIGTRIMFSPELRATFTGLAKAMAGDAMTPKHLAGNENACFHVVRLALNWNMDWYQLAQRTYSPAEGKIGIEGAVAVGAMLGSRKVIEVKFEHFGDWDKIAGKFEMIEAKYKDGNVKKNRDTGEIMMVPKATWTPEDEAGLGVVATAVMHDGREVSTPKIHLNQCYPRNSAQWWLAPARQICHVASRALANLATADIMLGVSFDDGLAHQEEAPPVMRNVTPQAVDLEQEGVQGGGETEPMTESGIVEDALDDMADDVRETARKVFPEDGAQTEKRKRIKFVWRGNTISKTHFARDVKQLIKQHLKDDDGDELFALKDEILGVCEANFEHRGDIWESVREDLVAAVDQYEGGEDDGPELMHQDEADGHQTPHQTLDLAGDE